VSKNVFVGPLKFNEIEVVAPAAWGAAVMFSQPIYSDHAVPDHGPLA
jgi:hypothetical protein